MCEDPNAPQGGRRQFCLPATLKGRSCSSNVNYGLRSVYTSPTQDHEMNSKNLKITDKGMGSSEVNISALTPTAIQS